MHSVYRQQHVCSNLLHTVEKSFLKSLYPQLKDVRSAFPYHPEEISKEMQLIYQHLNLRQCKWSFDAWYSMSDLVELCGGSVTSDFKVNYFLFENLFNFLDVTTVCLICMYLIEILISDFFSKLDVKPTE